MFDFGIARNGVTYFHNLRAVIRWRDGGMFFIVRTDTTRKSYWKSRY